MQIVTMKVQDLEGTLSLDRNGGTMWKITFAEGRRPVA
jgi:two-component sensor histidine kinase